jgi:hypothetical protein
MMFKYNDFVKVKLDNKELYGFIKGYKKFGNPFESSVWYFESADVYSEEYPFNVIAVPDQFIIALSREEILIYRLSNYPLPSFDWKKELDELIRLIEAKQYTSVVIRKSTKSGKYIFKERIYQSYDSPDYTSLFYIKEGPMLDYVMKKYKYLVSE